MNRGLLSNLLEALGIAVVAVGAGLWIHPGAGLMAAGAYLALVGFATDSETPNEGDQ